MENKFSIEYLYNVCMNQSHALGIEFKFPMLLNDKYYDGMTIVSFDFSEEDKECIIKNIMQGKNTFSGRYMCRGYMNDVGIPQEQGLCLDLDNIESVELC